MTKRRRFRYSSLISEPLRRLRLQAVSAHSEARRDSAPLAEAPAPIRKTAELASVREAILVAEKIAQKTRRTVTVRDANYSVIEIVSAPSLH